MMEAQKKIKIWWDNFLVMIEKWEAMTNFKLVFH